MSHDTDLRPRFKNHGSIWVFFHDQFEVLSDRKEQRTDQREKREEKRNRREKEEKEKERKENRQISLIGTCVNAFCACHHDPRHPHHHQGTVNACKEREEPRSHLYKLQRRQIVVQRRAAKQSLKRSEHTGTFVLGKVETLSVGGGGLLSAWLVSIHSEGDE